MNISNGQLWKYSSFIENKNYSFNKEEILNYITKKQIDEAYSTISKWESYEATPLLQVVPQDRQRTRLSLTAQKYS